MTTSTMSRFRAPGLALAALLATLALSACGNKGPLVLPDRTAPGEAVAPEGTTPAAPATTPPPTTPPTTPAIDETSSPLPPSSPPPAADPLLNPTDDDGDGP